MRIFSRPAVLFFASLLVLPALAHASQSNFQLLPAPIAYPEFEPNRTDFKLGAGIVSVSGNDIDLHGGGAYFIARRAVNEHFAIDGLLGGAGFNGTMPGFALPFVFGTNVWNPVLEGKGKLTGIGVPLGLNLEIQPIHTPRGSLILFGGPNMSLYGLTLNTPYHARTGSTNAASTTFQTKSTVFLGGFQLGLQAGLNIGDITLAPFYMVITQSGSASFTFDDGYRGTDQIQGDSTNVEPFVVSSYGADLIYRPWNLSIGTLIQDAGSTTNQAGYKTSTVQVTWHFRGS